MILSMIHFLQKIIDECPKVLMGGGGQYVSSKGYPIQDQRRRDHKLLPGEVILPYYDKASIPLHEDKTGCEKLVS